MSSEVQTERIKRRGPHTSTLGGGFDFTDKKEGDQMGNYGVIINLADRRVCEDRSEEACKACVAAGHAKTRGCNIPQV